MKLSRRYQLLPDYAECQMSATGCPFYAEGDTAEKAAAAHVEETGHQVRVETGATVIIGPPSP